MWGGCGVDVGWMWGGCGVVMEGSLTVCAEITCITENLFILH